MPQFLKYTPPGQKSLDTATTGNGRAFALNDCNAVQFLIVGSAGIAAGAVNLESAHDINYAGVWNQLVAPVTAVASAAVGGSFQGTPIGGFVRCRVTTTVTGGTVDVYINGTMVE
jgi:hypothetical protein